MSNHVEWVPATCSMHYATPPQAAQDGMRKEHRLQLISDDVVMVFGTRNELVEFAERVLDVLDIQFDYESSGSRQHYVDTGRFIAVREG